jgi:hypothetical protein
MMLVTSHTGRTLRAIALAGAVSLTVAACAAQPDNGGLTGTASFWGGGLTGTASDWGAPFAMMDPTTE